MGRLHLRKNNIGKAIIRFLIGLLILAILVWLLYEFVLTGEFSPSSRMDSALPLNGTQPAQTTTVSGTKAAISLPVDTLSVWAITLYAVARSLTVMTRSKDDTVPATASSAKW